MLVNVFPPVTVSAPAPSFDSVQLKVDPPPVNVLEIDLVMLILPVPVPAVVVKPDGAALLNELPEIDSVPPLKVMFFVPVAVLRVTDVRVFPFKLRVPFVIIAPVDTRAS